MATLHGWWIFIDLKTFPFWLYVSRQVTSKPIKPFFSLVSAVLFASGISLLGGALGHCRWVEPQFNKILPTDTQMSSEYPFIVCLPQTLSYTLLTFVGCNCHLFAPRSSNEHRQMAPRVNFVMVPPARTWRKTLCHLVTSSVLEERTYDAVLFVTVAMKYCPSFYENGGHWGQMKPKA